MAYHNADETGSLASDDWIELHNVAPANDNNEVSTTNRPSVPNLRIDTSQLDPETFDKNGDADGDKNKPPQSAILGLVKGKSSAMDNWLPEMKKSENDVSSAISPAKSLHAHRRPSQNSTHLRSPTSPSPSRTNLHTRRLSRASQDHSIATIDSHNDLSNEYSNEHPSEHRNEHPVTPIPQLRLTVERSFAKSDPETPLFMNAEGDDDDENVFDKIEEATPSRLRSSPARSLRRPSINSNLSVKQHSPNTQKRNLSLSGAAYAAQQDLLDAEEQGRGVDSSGVSSNDDFDIRSTSSLSAHRTTDTNSEYDEDQNHEVERLKVKAFKEPIGRSLFYLSSENWFRRIMFRIVNAEFVHYIEVILTVCQVVVLCVDEWSAFTLSNGQPNVLNHRTQSGFAGLYIVFTLMALARCVAFGVITNEALTVAECKYQLVWIGRKLFQIITLGSVKAPNKPSIFSKPGSFYNCFLRTSWGRVEFISIVVFWAMMGEVFGSSVDSLDLIAAGLAHIRILKLLDEITYTRIVLHVIKTAIPLLFNVLIFIGFFLAVWGVTGLQSFNGSLRRVCVYGETITTQNCGSWLHPETNKTMPYLLLDSARGTYQSQPNIKGYACPIGSKCVELRAFPPYGSFASLANQSFDNIFNALEIVFIMMSNNGFTPIMYDVMDSEYMVSCLFFISGVLILGIWLMNLLVAVMVSSYSSVKSTFDTTLDDSNLSRLGQRVWRTTIGRVFRISYPTKYTSNVDGTEEILPGQEQLDTENQRSSIQEKRDHGNWIMQNTKFGKLYGKIYPLYTILAGVDLIVQASRTSPNDRLLGWQFGLASIFAGEMLFRYAVYLPYWRYFFFSFTNLLDLFLAIANFVILAFYNNDEVYAWLTAFQLLRVYRMVGAFKYSRVFWLQVFGNFKALASLTAFFFLCTFFCTLVAVKMLRGQFPMETDGETNASSFYSLAVGFFSMYQVASTENWTDTLFWTTNNVSRPGNNVAGLACMGILLCGWLFFANFLIFNLFVGIMSESLHGAISNKREEQVRQFFEEVKEVNLAQRGPVFKHMFSNIGSSSRKRQIDGEDADRPVKYREKIMAWIMRQFYSDDDSLSVSKPMRTAVERQFVIEFLEAHGNLEQFTGGKVVAGKSFLSLDSDKYQNVFGFSNYAKLPFVAKCKHLIKKFFSWFHHYPEEYRAFLIKRLEQQTMSHKDSHKLYVESMFEEKSNTLAILDEYCKKNPKFDRPLLLFGRDNKIRQFCQKLVTSSSGARLSNIYPNSWVWLCVRTFFIAATVSIVVQTCVNTPLQALNDDTNSTNTIWTYSRIIDLVYGIIFSVEFLVKVIADGFHFTPNAYTWSMWNCLDFIVLISIWMTFINDLVNGVLSRYLRALLALRALRLISFSRQSELLLSSVFMYGLRNILGACLITLSIVIPYSVWGKNIFHDRLRQCNDGDVDFLSQCTGEYVSTVFENFEVLAPRVVEEQYFNYNNFWQSLLIQFGVLSLEGWVDVLEAVTSITGKDQQPETYASKGNAAYPILYHYIGAVLIMTMLIAVIIRNYALTMGTAFLTEQQLSWLDVKRTLKLLKPTPRPPQYKYGTVRHQLLKIIPTWINSIELWALFIASVDMASYYYPVRESSQNVYQLVFVGCSLLLSLLSILRLIVLQPTLFFHNWWNPFGLVVSISVTTLTIVNIILPGHTAPGALAANRIADVSLLLLWIPRTKKLYQFYIISTAAISEISMLLRAWFALFITYAIALNQSFGLTKLGTQSTWSRNFRTIPKALIALFTMSCGEGWNELLIDYTLSKPYCRENSEFSECGIPGFAYFLFITWNILSMYVFANLFISLICEACWYVYRSGPVNISERDIVQLLDSWQQFDPKGTGYIRRKDLYKFLGRTQGYFSISIFSQDSKYNVHRIIAATQRDARNVVDPYNVDMDAINKYLSTMPVGRYREKRSLYEMFAMHAKLSSDIIPGGTGIRFKEIMLMFPLYKDMNPADTLTLKEFIALRVQLYDAQLTLAANFVVRRWRYKRQQQHNDLNEIPGVGYDQSWSQDKPYDSVYWVS